MNSTGKPSKFWRLTARLEYARLIYDQAGRGAISQRAFTVDSEHQLTEIKRIIGEADKGHSVSCVSSDAYQHLAVPDIMRSHGSGHCGPEIDAAHV
jgi:hypothetical protein